MLRDVNLHIFPGETVSFVGATGAGKSTIAKLVTRFYDPTAGHIYIDGIPLESVTIHSLRRQLGVVPQEPFLFSGTIRDNVAFARPDATDEEVLEAIDAVGLSELMERLPFGIDTAVHERGQSLASGERQLIALAPRVPCRAACARPRRGDFEPRPQVRDDGGKGARPSARRTHRDPHRPPTHHRDARRPDRGRRRTVGSSRSVRTTC